MIELKGKYNTAKVFTDNIESSAIGQITALLNQKSIEGSTVRIMPDVHSGAGCVIGTTMTMMKYTSLTHPSFVAWCSFAAIWSILGFVLCAIGLITSRTVKFGENVTYLNY